jgi:hypothetical protein
MEKKHIVPAADSNGDVQEEYSRKSDESLVAMPIIFQVDTPARCSQTLAS